MRKLLSRIYIGYAHVVRPLFSNRDIIYTCMHNHNIHKFEITHFKTIITSKAIHLYCISSMIVEQLSQVLATKNQQFSTDVLSTFSNHHGFTHMRGRLKHNFDNTHRARSLIPLNSGDDIWLQKEGTTATVQ